MTSMRNALTTIVLVLCITCSLQTSFAQLAALEQQAFDEAVSTVSDSVVQIRTIGGLDRVGKTLISQGPTTGLVVSSDGYIVSSAFNFAAQPSSIVVRLADGQQLAAELIARDKNRMLVLLKINADRPLPVPAAVASDEIQVGQWAIALGRTFQSDQVDISVGIISATKRMYGRVIQTDANISVANYGGPLVDVSGRVLGVLVPMSPQATSNENAELAGAQFYDSGIGFAVPLEHVLNVLDRWKDETELLPGKLGIGLAKGDAHVTEPKITSIWPGSPAASAKWQAKDVITSVNGTKVSTQAQLRFKIMPLYAGDSIRVTLDRAGEEIETELKLIGKLPPFRHAFLGILPGISSDLEEEGADGVPVRLVWPESPAALAGLQSGDRITKLDEIPIKVPSNMQVAMNACHPDQEVALVVVRGEEELEFTASLATMPEEILSSTSVASLNTATEVDAEDAALKPMTVPEFSQEAVYWASTAEAGRQPGLLLWLGDGNADQNQQLLDDWQAACQRLGLVLMIAPPKKDSSWETEDLSYLQQLVRLAAQKLNVDRSRTVVIGPGKAGQLAYALALSSRSSSAGIISIDAPLPRTLSPPATSPSNRLAVLAVESDGSNFAPLIRRDVEKLRDLGYPTTWLQKPMPDEASSLDSATRSSIERWLIGLDRL